MVDLSHSGENTCLEARGSPPSRSRSITPAAARWSICLATRPTPSCGWWPSGADLSGFISCRSSTRRAKPAPTTWFAISSMPSTSAAKIMSASAPMDADRRSTIWHAIGTAGKEVAARRRPDRRRRRGPCHAALRRRPARPRPVPQAHAAAKSPRPFRNADREDHGPQLPRLREGRVGGVKLPSLSDLLIKGKSDGKATCP